MYSKFVTLALIICVCGVNGITYKEAISACKVEYKLLSDAPLDNFLATGSFKTGEENLKCYFDCMTTKLGVADAQGIIQVQTLDQVAKLNPSELELQGFADANIQKKCLPEQAAGANPCDKVFAFVKCAVLTGIELKKSS